MGITAINAEEDGAAAKAEDICNVSGIRYQGVIAVTELADIVIAGDQEGRKGKGDDDGGTCGQSYPDRGKCFAKYSLQAVMEFADRRGWLDIAGRDQGQQEQHRTIGRDQTGDGINRDLGEQLGGAER